MFDVWELYLNFLFKDTEEIFFKGDFSKQIFKVKSMWLAKRGCRAQKCYQLLWCRILCLSDKSELCLAGGCYCVLSRDQWWKHCPSSRRLRLEISFWVSRETLSGHKGIVTTVPYTVLNLQDSWVRDTVHVYSLPWGNSHFYLKIRVAGWVTTKEVLAFLLLGGTSPVI